MQFFHFNETAVNALIQKAPLLKELTLWGKRSTEKLEKSDKISIKCRNIRLVNIEGAFDLKEIELKKARSSNRDIIVLKGDTTT